MPNDTKRGFTIAILSILSSTVLGVVTIGSTLYTKSLENSSKYKLKELEITYSDKKLLFSRYINALNNYRKFNTLQIGDAVEENRSQLIEDLQNSLQNMALFIPRDVYVDYENRNKEIIELSQKLYFGKLEASAMSEKYQKESQDKIQQNINYIISDLQKQFVRNL